MKINFYRAVMLVGLIIWIAETAFFGFNPKAESNIEGFLDTLSWMLIIGGWVGDIFTGINITKIEHSHFPEVKTVNCTGEVTITNSKA